MAKEFISETFDDWHLFLKPARIHNTDRREACRDTQASID
jgi:hypothetical protein